MARAAGGPPGLGSVLGLLAGFVSTAMLAGVMVAGLFMPAVGASGQLARGGVEFFDSLPEELQVGTLSQQSRILWADGTPMATFYYENRVLVPLSNVAPTMRQATVAIEDSRFYEHNGADPQGILRAIANNASGGDTQGASTLTQQWIKNVLLDQAIAAGDKEQQAALMNPDKGRKVREIKLALAAEKEYTKDQILENYLNIALFGDGQYGVETAAQHFLSKSAKDLTLQDSALLAGIIRSPYYYDPVDYPQRAFDRRNTVLQRMLELKMITQEQHDVAVAVPLEAQLAVREVKNGCEAAGTAAYFCDYVVKTILNDAAFGEDVGARQRLLYRGGLTITTTLDRTKQQLAQDAVNDRVPPTDPSGVGRGAVVGGGRHRPDRGDGAELGLLAPADRGAGARRDGHQLQRRQGDGRRQTASSPAPPTSRSRWRPGWRRQHHERVGQRQPARSTRTATSAAASAASSASRTSRRTARGQPRQHLGAAGHLRVGQHRVHGHGVAAGRPVRGPRHRRRSRCAPGRRQAARGLPRHVLGTNEVAPLTMAAAYAAFANKGIWCKPIAIAAVSDASGKVLPKPEPECKQAIDTDIANGVAYGLSQVLARGTARGTSIGRPAAGKTGTTNKSSETWFTGFTPGGLSTSVWVGTPNDEPSSLNNLTIDGRPPGAASTAPPSRCPTWDAYMTGASRACRRCPSTRPPSSIMGQAPRPSTPATTPPPPAVAAAAVVAVAVGAVPAAVAAAVAVAVAVAVAASSPRRAGTTDRRAQPCRRALTAAATSPPEACWPTRSRTALTTPPIAAMPVRPCSAAAATSSSTTAVSAAASSCAGR